MTGAPPPLESLFKKQDANRHETLLDKCVKRLLFYAHRVGRRRAACVALVIALTIGLRCALLPWLPRPQPYVHDEQAYLLGADTFASGRLANSAHPLWQFFESGQIVVYPSYAMKYQPGQAAFLALGQVLFGDPYWGVVISVGLMAGAICWMMQGLLLPGWALIGGLFTAAAFGGGHYWIQSYWGGAVTALASALMIGAFVRIVQRRRHRFIWLFAAGTALGLLTRPYEIFVLAAILTVALMAVHIRSKSWTVLGKMAPPYVFIMAACACFQLYYNWRVTGNALELPYMLHEKQYALVPSFWMLPLHNISPPQDPVLYSLHWGLEKDAYDALKDMGPLQRAGVLLRRSITAVPWRPSFHATLPGLLGFLLYVLAFTPVFWFSRRVHFLAALGMALALSTCLVVWAFLHYFAPLIVVALALIFLLSTYLRSLTIRARRVGNLLVAFILLYLPVEPLLIAHSSIVLFSHGGDVPYVTEHARIESALDHSAGRHVVIVRYKPDKGPRPDWVYNSANIDAQRIVWARDRGAFDNRKLLAYYHDRHIWVLYADESPARLEPYRE